MLLILGGCSPCRPSGNLMASTQRKPNRHDVIFFERNGLQHGEFTLHAGRLDLVIKEMQWNGDSTVLALWLEGMPTPHCDTPKPTTGKTTFAILCDHCYEMLKMIRGKYQ